MERRDSAMAFRDPELNARAAIETAHPGWRTERALHPWVVRPDIPVPSGHFWAAHAIWEVPCVVAASVEELSEALDKADHDRLSAVVEEVSRRYPGWKVGYLGPGRTPRGVRGERGQFYALRKRFGWRSDPAIGWTAEGLCKSIARVLRAREH